MDVFSFNLDRRDILIYRSTFTPVKSNMFVLLTEDEAIVFDPNENEELLRLLYQKQIKKVHILLTHEHYDHTSGVNWLLHNFQSELYCQKKCATSIEIAKNNNPALIALVLHAEDKKDGGYRYQEFKKKFKPYSCKADRWFEKRGRVVIKDWIIDMISTPGHSHGSACYILNNRLVFTGDTLLQNTPIITRFPESDKHIFDEQTLPFLQSLRKDLIILPGHGDPFILSEINNV